MGSIGTAKKELTTKALNPDSYQSKSFVQLFNAILRENDIPIQKSEEYKNGRIKGISEKKILQDGVSIERQTSRYTRGIKKGLKDEVIIIETRGFMSEEDAQNLVRKIREAEVYKNGIRDSKIASTGVYVNNHWVGR